MVVIWRACTTSYFFFLFPVLAFYSAFAYLLACHDDK